GGGGRGRGAHRRGAALRRGADEGGGRGGQGGGAGHPGDARRLAHGAARPPGAAGEGGGAGGRGARTGVSVRAPARGESGVRRGAGGVAREARRRRAPLRAGPPARGHLPLQAHARAGRGVRLAAQEPALVVTKGAASPEVAEAYARARALSEGRGEPMQLLGLLLVLCGSTLDRAGPAAAQPLADQALAAAERAGLAPAQVFAHLMQA